MLTNLYSVMFHHFHGGRHPRVQGSIDQEQLSKVIEFLDNNSNLVWRPIFWIRPSRINFKKMMCV